MRAISLGCWLLCLPALAGSGAVAKAVSKQAEADRWLERLLNREANPTAVISRLKFLSGERRAADVSAERQRLQARLALRERKADEAYQDWLRQMRDRAYVEYRLEDR